MIELRVLNPKHFNIVIVDEYSHLQKHWTFEGDDNLDKLKSLMELLPEKIDELMLPAHIAEPGETVAELNELISVFTPSLYR